MSDAPLIASAGLYELQHRLGEGAMGEVWMARHARRGTPAAVKLLTLLGDADARHRAAFRHEVQAMARLVHPGIVKVYDCGDEATLAGPDASRQLVPWYAMEVASFGTLQDQPALSDWTRVRTVLSGVLEALAHAHARGIVHRDIKPANILVTAHRGSTRVMLTDFGIAHGMHDARTVATSARGAGTPAYMAPEQIEGDLAAQGPWTDLYAVGALAYELCAGHLPFWGDGVAQTMLAHVSRPVPRLVPQFPVPDDLELWLRWLLAKDSVHRASHAADALRALKSMCGAGATIPAATTPMRVLPDPPEPGTSGYSEATPTILESLGSVAARVDQPEGAPPTGTLTLHAATLQQDTVGETGKSTQPSPPPEPADPNNGELETAARDARRGGERWGYSASSVPWPDWRPVTAEAATSSEALLGEGLVGLRELALVGREPIRDLLWSTLRASRDDATARVIVMQGPDGGGKGALARWFCQRAVELGHAHVMTAVHSPTDGPGTGLSRMVARDLGCVGLSARAVRKRCGVFAQDDLFAAGLAELVAPGDHDDHDLVLPHLHLRTASERHRVVHRLLAQRAAKRPVILWLDSAQWGYDALCMVTSLLESPPAGGLPVVVLVTATSASHVQRPLGRDLLASLSARSDATALEIAATSDEEHRALIGQLLPLTPQLSAKVADATRGHPLFAVQLIGDWVARGILSATSDGFEIREDVRDAFPRSLHQLWLDRVDRALGELPSRFRGVAWEALEVAAALGLVVDMGEWRAALTLAGLDVPEDVLDPMLRHGLAQAETEGQSWVFGHALLRQSIERRAVGAERWQAHQRSCAAMVASLHPADDAEACERLARHQLAAGDVALAIEPLFVAIEGRQRCGELAPALALLDLYDGAVATVLPSDVDPRRLAALAKRAQCLVLQGDHRDAETLLDDVQSKAGDVMGDREVQAVVAECFWTRGMLASGRADLKAGLGWYQLGVDAYSALGDPRGAGYCLSGLGDMQAGLGDTVAARSAYEQAIQALQSCDDQRGVGFALTGLANVYRRSGATAAALATLAQARAARTLAGDQLGVARCLVLLGEIARAEDQLDAAQAHYEAALATLSALGSQEASLARLNLGVLAVVRRDFVQGRALLQSARDDFARARRVGYVAGADVLLLPCLAAARDWAGWDRALNEGGGQLSKIGLVDPDFVMAAELGSELAAARGETARAQAARVFAARQRQRLTPGGAGGP